MKAPSRSLIPMLVLLSVLLSACTVTPVIPSATPTPPAATDWTQIVERGTLTVGTSADYPPFAYYDDQFRLTGFDPELIRQIGQNLGLDVQLKDIPFSGLRDSLDAGQIDVAISAISVTPEHDAEMDFTDVYYVSEDAFLAQKDAEITSLGAVEEVQQQALVGVQEGSVYENWARQELVDKGLLPERNLLLYSDISRAVNDLERGRIDFVILDAAPAERFASERDVKIVAQGLNRQRYAIAVPNGSDELRRQLNAALEQLRDDGTLQDLTTIFFGLGEGEVPALPTSAPTATSTATATATPTSVPAQPTKVPTATPIPTATPVPLPTRCLDSSSFVADLTFDDDNMQNPPVLLPGQAFIKSWRLRNSGSCTWTNLYRLAYVQGNVPAAQMGGQPVYVSGWVRPGQTGDFSVPLIAPLVPGTYQGFWQMVNDLNQPFGQRVWVGIRVAPPVTATPRPTQTPSPQIYFVADRTNIRAGDPVLFTWSTSNVKEVYFYREGQNWWDYGVSGNGSRTEYPDRTVSYFLRVVKRDNSVDLREIRIYVEPSPNAPEIVLFSVVPDGRITLGQCVQVDWDVRGEVDDVDIYRNNRGIWEDAPLRATLQDCPNNVGSYEYRIEADGPGGQSRSARYVDVVQPVATPTPTRTPVPTPTMTPTQAPAAVIQQFSVRPGQIQVGQCFSIDWSVGGSPSLIQILRNGMIVFDNAPYSGVGQDCPLQAGSYTYQIDVYNLSGVLSDTRSESTSVLAPQPTSTPTTPPPTQQPTPTSPATAPEIQYFNLSASQINLGECVTLSWSFTGDSLAAASITRNGEKVLGDPPTQGEFVDCPPDPGELFYVLSVSSEFAGTVEETRQLIVAPPIQSQ